MKVQVTNVVGTLDIERELELTRVVEVLGEDAIYDTDQFPGIIFKSKTIVPKLLIFRTGRCVIAGARSIDELNETAKHIDKIFKDNPKVFR